ncbi:MAG: hypothetical protein SGPRY_006753, partial [Prymnesium sp.]
EAAQVAQLLSDTGLESSVDLNELLSESLDLDQDADLGSRDELFSPCSDSAASNLSEFLTPTLYSTKKARGVPSQPRATGHQQELPKSTPYADNPAVSRVMEVHAARAQAERETNRVAMEAEHMRTRQELDEVRAKVQEMQTQLPALRERLASTKASFALLRITEEHYRTLKAMPEESVSVVEHVQLRVHELLQHSSHDEEAIIALRAKAAIADHATVQLQTQIAAKDALQSRLDEAHARASQLQAEAEAARAESRRIASQAAEFASSPEGVMRATLLETEAQLGQAKIEIEAKNNALTRFNSEVASMQSEIAEANSKLSFLQQDKDYLKRQVGDLTDRLGTTEARLSKKESKVDELKASLGAAQEKLVAATSDHVRPSSVQALSYCRTEDPIYPSESFGNPRAVAENYAIKLETEMAKWEQQSARALRAAEEGFEAQVRQHKGATETATAEAEKWQLRYDEAKKISDELMLRASETSATAEVQIAQLRSELRIKAFEVERLTAQYEQTSAGSRRGELESDAWREKLENNALLERLKAYEKLEEELDKTVIQAVASDMLGAQTQDTVEPADRGGSKACGGTSALAAVQPLIRVPSSSQRRMEQCLSLARELLTAQNRADDLEVRRHQLEAEIAKLKAQLADAQQLVRSIRNSFANI